MSKAWQAFEAEVKTWNAAYGRVLVDLRALRIDQEFIVDDLPSYKAGKRGRSAYPVLVEGLKRGVFKICRRVPRGRVSRIVYCRVE